MIRVVVEVMLKPEILDPQGQAVASALPRLGFEQVALVRQGKRFEMELREASEEAALAAGREIAATMLANPVIEDYSVRVDAPAGDRDTGADDYAGAGAGSPSPSGNESSEESAEDKDNGEH